MLYNFDVPESVAWAQWYQEQRMIPSDHLLGLTASTDEHLPDLAAAQTQVITPVRDYLAANPEIQQRVMGIVLGFGLPGHYAQPPIVPNVGGYSIADALQDMTDDHLAPASQKQTNLDNPHTAGLILPAGGRLTKATMRPNRYMTARIDGPTLDDAKALTLRAKVLSDPLNTLHGQSVWYDYHDPSFPPSSREWYWLKTAAYHAFLADLPWANFDLRGQSGSPLTPLAAFRFDIYKLYGWTVEDFAADALGSQVFAYDFNSFGAVTVRSTTAQGALLVPNALAAGYAAAIGATGEPQCCVGPFPDTLLASLREGWTLGEAFYLANPYNDWMWTLVGDPFLTLPNWFNEVEITPGNGDVNLDGFVDGRDIPAFVDKLLYGLSGNESLRERFGPDMNKDGFITIEDLPLFVEALLQR